MATAAIARAKFTFSITLPYLPFFFATGAGATAYDKKRNELTIMCDVMEILHCVSNLHNFLIV